MIARIAVGLLVGVASLGLAPAGASAGGFTLRACQADSDGKRYSTAAFAEFVTRGMRVRRACAPAGPGERGLVIGNVVRRRTLPRGARATLQVTAAPGTSFTRLAWSGELRRKDCSYRLSLYARWPSGEVRWLEGIEAGRQCPKRRLAQAAMARDADLYDISGAYRIVQRIECAARRRKRCSARGTNRVITRQFEVGVQDVTPPAVTITNGGQLTNRWLRDFLRLRFVATDSLGVQSVWTAVDGGRGPSKPFPCSSALPTPCRNGADAIDLNTQSVPEGTHHLTLHAADGAHNEGASAPIRIHVDNTAPPAAPVAVDGGSGWRARNGYAVRWANPAEPDRAPIGAARYRLCRVAGACQDPVTRLAPGIASFDRIEVPAPGEWTVRVWRIDGAGNTDERNASAPVTLRYDPEPPRAAFNPQSAADPTAVGVTVADELSGVQGGQIELSREGSGVWRTLPTALTGDRLGARIDDGALPPGRYRLRAFVTDRVGNRAATDRRAGGAPAEVVLPLRSEARIGGGIVRDRIVRVRTGKGRRRRTVRRRVTELRATARVRHGARAELQGTVATADGRPLAGATLFVFAAAPGAAPVGAGIVSTDAAGRYSYPFVASGSRRIRLVYPGSPVVRPASREVSVEVPAVTTFRVSRRRVLNGRSVVFSGQLAAPPAGLAAGKLVELQTRLSGRWQTFRTFKTDVLGGWSASYRFRRTRGLVRYRFRVRLPSEAGYPFVSGKSRVVRVTVRGR